MPDEVKAVFTMPVRGVNQCLLWLCAAILLHIGLSCAEASGSTLQDTRVQHLTPALGETPQSRNDVTDADSGTTASSVQPTIPELARETLKALAARHGDPLPGYVGGRTFQNREHALPPGHYREYDVHPKVPGKNRGSERIVINQRSGKAYYTADHYHSFIPMN